MNVESGRELNGEKDVWNAWKRVKTNRMNEEYELFCMSYKDLIVLMLA